MTTGENTDSINESENLTVTSDAAFERVTNDFKMEEEIPGGYLKQNTAGLVQEIPNISFLDISDTMLESHKTLHNRKNRNIVVGLNGKSIEAQPQDIGIYRDIVPELNSGLGYPKFNTYLKGSNNTCFGSNTTMPGIGAYEIKEDGIYRMSYSYTISDISSSATLISRYIMLLDNGGTLTQINSQCFGNGIGGQSIGISSYSASGDTHIELHKGDRLMLAVKVTDTNGGDVGRGFTQAELTLQFQQYTL